MLALEICNFHLSYLFFFCCDIDVLFTNRKLILPVPFNVYLIIFVLFIPVPFTFRPYHLWLMVSTLAMSLLFFFLSFFLFSFFFFVPTVLTGRSAPRRRGMPPCGCGMCLVASALLCWPARTRTGCWRLAWRGMLAL
jgi:hypothetical protein